MWVTSDDGIMTNLAKLGSIWVKGCDIMMSEQIDGRDEMPISGFETRAQAVAARDRLEKWMGSKDGLAGHKTYDIPGVGLVTKPQYTQVFSFRTLGEDDEF
jgi:hypothetical protein